MATLGFSQFTKQSAGKLALAAPDGRYWSRGELLSKSHQIAHCLRFLGMGSGDSVVALLPNSAELIALQFAVSQIGGVLIPLPCGLNTEQVTHTLLRSRAVAFIAHEEYCAVAQQAANRANNPGCIDLAIGNVIDFLPFNSLVEIYPETAPQKSRPECPQAHLFALLEIHPESNNVHFCGSALSNSGVMFWATQSLHHGHALVLRRQWDAREMLQAIGKYRVTTSYVFQSQFEQLLSLPFSEREQYDLSSIRHVVTDAQPGDPEINRAMNRWWRESIYEFYADEPQYGKAGSQSFYPTTEIEKLGKGHGIRDTQAFSDNAKLKIQKLTMKNH